MHNYRLEVQTSARNGRIAKLISDAARVFPFDSLTAAVAYATENGCKRLVDILNESNPNWENVEKKWLVSIDYGTTESEALRYLNSLPNSRVYIYNAHQVIANRLFPKMAFHPKIYVFSSRFEDNISIVSGSANLTGGGLFTNNEQASFFSVSQPIKERDQKFLSSCKIYKWQVESYFGSSVLCTEELIELYEEALLANKRNSAVDSVQLVQLIESDRPSIEISEIASLSASKNLWLETGYITPNRGPGKYGNQIDLQRGIKVFFGFFDQELEPNTNIGEITITLDGIPYSRTLRLGNNQMEKLSLPIIDPPDYSGYENKTLLFVRDGPRSFTMHIASPENSEEWKRRSRLFGEIYELRSGRQYGIF